MSKPYWFLIIAAVLTSTALAVDLTGHWMISPDTDIYVRQIDNGVWWYCESIGIEPSWTSVANGTIDGNIVNLRWVDVPKGNLTLTGTLMLNVTSDSEMQLLNQTGGWGGENWTEIRITRV